jgi:hypothetical protein
LEEITLGAESLRDPACQHPGVARRHVRPVAERQSAGARLALVAVLVAAYMAMHLATITISRLPWFDDTFFASIADAVRRTGRFTLEVSPLWLSQPVYLYGPVYFLTLAGVFEGLGFGLLQTRLPAVLCGFGIIAVGYLLLRRSRVRPQLAFATCAVLALDPTVHQSIHSGRTDSMALFLLLASFLLLLEARERGSVWWTAASGAVGALGALTTPRPGYLLIPMGLILLWRWGRKPDRRRALDVAVWGGTSVLLLAAWVAWAFGGLPEMFAYFRRFSDTYAGGGFGVRVIHAPVLAPLLMLLGAMVVVRPRALLDEAVFFYASGIVGFYTFVKDKGAFGGLYTFFMVPLVYLAIGYCLARIREAKPYARTGRYLAYGILGGLIAFNGGVFAARSTLEFLQRDGRRPTLATEVIARTIPPGSRVVGDDKFYFVVRQTGSDFQYFERGGSIEERARFHADDYDLQYLVTDQGDASPLLEAYRREMPLVPVATIEAPTDPGLARLLTRIAHWAGVGTSLEGSYAGRIFRRGPGQQGAS